MGTVGTSLTMSLDGFIAGPNDGPNNPLGENGMRLFNWYSTGDTECTVPAGTMTVKVSKASAEMLRESYSKIGALVTGRKTFDITNGWDGRHPADVPIFVLTHSVPEEWVKVHPDAPFTFVTDGVESAVAQAKEAAGEKNVGVGAASLVQQCLKAGLLDEIQVELVPYLLGKGVRMFDYLGVEPIDLEKIMVIDTPDVTHIRYRVVK
jgi:dihydrofolate reductase